MSKQIDAMTRAILLFEVNNQWLVERYNAPPSTTAIRVVGELHEAVAEQSAQEAELRRLVSFNNDLMDEVARLNKAVADEREACAKVCDDHATKDGFEGCYANACAESIRARGNT